MVSASKPTTKSRSTKKEADATDLLEADHDAVKKLLRRYERMKDSMEDADKVALATEICMELTVHAQVEEELFYPAVRGAIEDEDLMKEAIVEHASAKQLIAEIQSMTPTDDLYDAKVKVLSEYINHHVEEEQTDMFKKARSRKAGLDLVALGEAITARKEELKAAM